MKLSVSDKLAFIREYKKQGGKGNYLSAIKQYEDGGEIESNKVSTSVPYQAPTSAQIWQSTLPKQFIQQELKKPDLTNLQRTDIRRNIHTNRPVITPREEYEIQQAGKRNQSEIVNYIKSQQDYNKKHSDIIYNSEGKLEKVQNIGIQSTVSPIDAVVLGAGALYSGGVRLLGSVADNLINPLPISPNVTKNGLFGDILWDGYLPRLTRGDLPKGGYFRKIGNEKGLKDFIESGEARLPQGENNFTGTLGVYYSKNNPIEDYEGRFLIHHPGEGEIKDVFGGVHDKKFYTPNDKQYPMSITPVRLDDPNTTIYKRKFMSTRYNKIDKDKLEDAMKNVDKYENTEQLLRGITRWSARGVAGKSLYNQYKNFEGKWDK